MSKRDFAERFWEKVDTSGECWEWTACRNRGGYGVFQTSGSSQDTAHRVAHRLALGKIPDGMLVCHRCDNRGCVRPEHLFLGTDDDNRNDMIAKRRHRHGAAHGMAKLSEVDVLGIRNARAGGETLQSIATRYGVNVGTIWKIATGKLWRHVA